MNSNPLENLRLQPALEQWSHWCDQLPTIVRTLGGGLTNHSVLLQANTRQYVLRINAGNSDALDLNRAAEIEILNLAAQSNLAPTLVYADPEQNYLVTEYLEGFAWKNSQSATSPGLDQLATLLKSIHGLPTSPAVLEAVLDVKQKAVNYWASIDETAAWAQPLQGLMANIETIIEAVSATKQPSCLCHNDLVPENLILKDQELLAVDWEYAAIGNPYFDLAVVVEEHKLDHQSTSRLLSLYHDGNDTSPEQRQQLHNHRVLYRYLDCLWYGVQLDRDNASVKQMDTRVEGLEALLHTRI